MARLASINLYLSHGQDPDVSVYDTLTHEDRWNDHYDVILANPPFMSPKGGIRPHQRYSISSRRSEVLFVDYIMGHLNERGRAGVIVPEGVIFQQQRGHTELRRLLVDTCLVAVISLPGGVFQPYSGVKTSILIMDKELGRKTDRIAFFKVENDGYDLGAQRRPIAANDLPTVQAEIAEYRRRLRAGEPVNDFEPTLGLVVAKDKIARGGEYNLSGERYSVAEVADSQWPLMNVGEVFERSTKTVMPTDIEGSVTYVGLENVSQDTGRLVGDTVTENPSVIKSLKNEFGPGEILYGKLRPNLNKVWLSDRSGICSTDIYVIRPKQDNIITELYAYIFRSRRFNDAVVSQVKGAQLPRVGWDAIERLEIPLPPLEVQREIVAEIEGYQRVIDGARAVVDNWRPRIAIDPEWPVVEVGDAAFFQEGPGIRSYEYQDGGYPIINVRCVRDGYIDLSDARAVDSEVVKQKWPHFRVEAGDILFTTSGTIGRVSIVNPEHLPLLMNTSVVRFRTLDDTLLVNTFLYQYLRSDYFVGRLKSLATGSAQLNCGPSHIKVMQIPLPPLETQQAIVAEIEAEQAAVDHARDLAARMQGRIDAAIGRVWGGG